MMQNLTAQLTSTGRVNGLDEPTMRGLRSLAHSTGIKLRLTLDLDADTWTVEAPEFF